MVLILILLLTELFIISNVIAQGNFYLYCIGVFNYIISLAPPSTGLYFNLNGTIYLPGDTIPITDVGDSFLGDITNQVDPGPSLVCVTSNVNNMCCRGADHRGSGSVGNWIYPDGTIVIGNTADPNGDFTRSSHYQQIRLNRKRPDVMSPTGVYTCEVPDGSITHRATITLGEYKDYRRLMVGTS